MTSTIEFNKNIFLKFTYNLGNTLSICCDLFKLPLILGKHQRLTTDCVEDKKINKSMLIIFFNNFSKYERLNKLS